MRWLMRVMDSSLRLVKCRNKSSFRGYTKAYALCRHLVMYQVSAETQRRCRTRFKEIAEARCRVKVSSNSTGRLITLRVVIGPPNLDLSVFVNNLKTISSHLSG
jgi:hypothetical protein